MSTCTGKLPTDLLFCQNAHVSKETLPLVRELLEFRDNSDDTDTRALVRKVLKYIVSAEQEKRRMEKVGEQMKAHLDHTNAFLEKVCKALGVEREEE